MRDNNRENEPTKKKNNGLALHKMLTRVSVGHQLDRFYNITDNNERGSNRKFINKKNKFKCFLFI